MKDGSAPTPDYVVILGKRIPKLAWEHFRKMTARSREQEITAEVKTLGTVAFRFKTPISIPRQHRMKYLLENQEGETAREAVWYQGVLTVHLAHRGRIHGHDTRRIARCDIVTVVADIHEVTKGL